MSASFITRVRVAGLTVGLRVRGPFDRARFRHRFASYEVGRDDRPLDGSLDLVVDPAGRLLDPPEVPYPGVRSYATPTGVKFLRQGLSMWIDRDGRAEARVVGPDRIDPMPFGEEGGAAETPLRLLVSLRLLASGKGALFHASGWRSDRGAWLFVGRSGAGKTTLARSLPPDGVLSDDQVALTIGPTCALASTPFVGVLGRTIAPTSDPLRAIVVLDHERRGQLRALGPGERLGALLGCLPLYARSAHLAGSALSVIARLDAVPVFTGSFAQNEGVAPWLARLDARVAAAPVRGT